MTTGNTNYETTITTKYGLPQVTEYCLCRLKDKKFLLLDIEWLYELYNREDDENKVYGRIRTYFENGIEDLLHLSLSQPDTNFIHEMVEPAKLDNTITFDEETEIYRLLEAVYLKINNDVAQSVAPKEYSCLNLVGFFGLTAIIGLSDDKPLQYPSFRELYGSVGAQQLRAEISNNAVLQTYLPFINGAAGKLLTF